MRPPRILHDDKVTIVRVVNGAPDGDGVPVTVTSRTEWPGVNVQQVAAEDLTDHERETQVVKFRVSGAIPTVPVHSTDRIEWDGAAFEIEGDPDTRRGRYRIEHTSLTMTKVRG